jgi:argininosuccinate lyase
MWLRDEITLLLGEIADLQRALVSLGEKNSDVLIPGYTHLQRAQPVYLAHHLLAYVEMLERDCERLWDCHSRVNVCPLGSGAIAGSTLPLKRELVAKLLNFVDANGKVQLTQNSMDAVSDRDFAVVPPPARCWPASFAARGGRLGERGIQFHQDRRCLTTACRSCRRRKIPTSP